MIVKKMELAGCVAGCERRTIREELLTNILVEAGAGSGKTQMLAERMAAGVAEGVYQIDGKGWFTGSGELLLQEY